MTKYETAISKALLNRKIVDVQFVDHYPILVLDDKTCVVIQRDDEGNGPGAMCFQTADGTPIDIWSKK